MIVDRRYIHTSKHVHTKSLQLCPTLCDAMDCSLPGSSVHGILQAGILEWVAMPSSRESSQPRIEPISYVSYIGRWVLYHQRHLLQIDTQTKPSAKTCMNSHSYYVCFFLDMDFQYREKTLFFYFYFFYCSTLSRLRVQNYPFKFYCQPLILSQFLTPHMNFY